MKTDRELLELAAKAAGVTGEYSEWWEMGEQFYSGFREDRTWGAWNPLIDDGDALRLAVQLCMNIEVTESDVYACTQGNLSEPAKPDRAAATRRAIVRAAAAIGEAMQ